MNGRFTEQETGAEYYVRELPDDTIAWVGEHAPSRGERKAFTNVFLGHRTAPTRVQGDLIDVPKGRARGVFRNLQVEITASGFHFDLPGVGRRTLRPAETGLPINDSLEWGAGFYDEATDTPPFLLTGVWQCSDGGSYYVRQVGTTIVWFGEHPSMRWSNIFFGERTGTRISGRWIDVPKGSTMGSGDLELHVTNDPLLNSLGPVAAETVLDRIGATGGFGGRTWNKTDSVRIAFRLENLHIVRNADIGGVNPAGDEPYLIPVYITIGGNQYANPAALITRARGDRPLVESPLFEHEWGTRADWPKNNLTWRENLLPGTEVAIPDYIAYGEAELRTLPRLQPNSDIGRTTANYVPGIIAMEEASTRNADIRAGVSALLDNAPDTIHVAIVRAVSGAIFGGVPPNIQAVVAAVRTALTADVEAAVGDSATSDLFGILAGLDPDKQMGADFTPFSIGRLRDDSALRGADIPVTMEFCGGADGLWRAIGTISATLGPARFAAAIEEFEVTFETGDDDKREGSTIELDVQAVGGNQGPFPVHSPEEGFAGRTLHTARLRLNPPVIFGNQLALVIGWRRSPGSFPREPDSWKLERFRVVAFDRFNRRHVLLNAELVDTKFGDNRELIIPLPRA